MAAAKFKVTDEMVDVGLNALLDYYDESRSNFPRESLTADELAFGKKTVRAVLQAVGNHVLEKQTDALTDQRATDA